MARFTFSIRELLVGIAFIAVGCGALIYASPLRLSLVFTGVLALLLFAILRCAK